MKRGIKRKLAGAGAIALLGAGAAIAAVTATGQTNGSHARTSAAYVAAASRSGPARGQHGGRGQLGAASRYLGLTGQQLRSELQSGRTLAQVADATQGKSAAGLIAALVSRERAKLDRKSANLSRRVTAEVNSPGGAPLRARYGRLGVTAQAAAAYLGISRSQLRKQLRSGKTLAQVADATGGKSAAGLVQALVGSRQKQLSAAVAAGKLTAAQEQAFAAKLRPRVEALVNGVSRGTSTQG